MEAFHMHEKEDNFDFQSEEQFHPETLFPTLPIND